jgi:regulator of protease activity HflC (stomatin/prohibitin superfamily)
MFYQTIRVRLNERVVIFKHGLPVRAYGPGKYVLFGRGLTEQRFATDKLVFNALPEVRAVLPHRWFAEVELAPYQRAVLFRDGVPELYLRPGVHRYWVIDPSVRLEVYDVGEPVPALTEALARVIPAGELASAMVQAHEKALLLVGGKLEDVLGPGTHRFWTTSEAPISIQKIDMRRTELAIAGQELMTRDKVTLRLSLSVEYAVADPVLANGVADVRNAVYVATQLAARDYVASVTLDQLLEGRDAMTRALEAVVVPAAARLGVRVELVGVKDVILPGEMKTLLNRVIEAEKEAQANVILRREETAATRSLANTAKVMAQEPILLRLKELETMKEIASRIAEVRVVVGADKLPTLLPAQLLASGPPSAE